MRQRLLVLLVLATAAAAPARAQEQPPPQPPRIPLGVTIAGIPVGGLTAPEAQTAVQAAFDRPLPFVFRTRRWQVKPGTLGASASVAQAVKGALVARPGAALRLGVRVNGTRVLRYAARLDRIFSRAPRNSVLLLRGLRPYLTEPRPGVNVRRFATANAIVRALRRTERTPIRVRATLVRPAVTRASYGSIVVIRRESRKLYLYRGMTFVRRFRIAVGMPRYPTPLGRFRIIAKYRNPTWNPPNSDWAAGLGPVPPGPGNPLGTRWIGLSAPGIGIHGTPQPWTVGTAASHGCIRMYIRESEWLFERVALGGTVFIVRA